MKKFTEIFEAVYAAVAFAEQGEWEEADRIASGSLRIQPADKKLQQRREAERRRSVQMRPRPRIR